MYYIVYKTTNLVNNKYYFGMHKQEIDPYTFDGYLGSGTLIMKAIKCHGRRNFIRETLFVFDNNIECGLKEDELIAPVLGNTDCYNLSKGGSGGINIPTGKRKKGWTEEQKAAYIPWNTGKTYEELLGEEKAKEVNDKNSASCSKVPRTKEWNENNSKVRTGVKRADWIGDRISEAKKANPKPAWNKGTKKKKALLAHDMFLCGYSKERISAELKVTIKTISEYIKIAKQEILYQRNLVFDYVI